MNDDQWDLKLKTFLKKTGGELKRAGRDIKTEAERLLGEVQSPQSQAQVKAGLRDLASWAKKTAEELATLVESGVKKAETAMRGPSEGPAPRPEAPPPSEAPRRDTPVDVPAVPEAAPAAAAAPAKPKKSIGKKKAVGPRPKRTAPKKTIGPK